MHEEQKNTKRILEMVESGRISAAEGTRLLESTRTTGESEPIKCPFCAETVVSRAGICPECGSHVHTTPSATAPSVAAGGFHALTGLGKFLVIYTLLITGFWLASTLLFGGRFFYLSPQSVIGSLLAALGMASGIMLIKSNPSGWNLGILWAALQIVEIIIHYQPINRQVLHLSANTHTNGIGFGINVVGIILLILFIKAKTANHSDRT